jgi:hypothetical protein
VLKEVGDARNAWALVPRTYVVPDLKADYGGRVVLMHQEGKTILQTVLFKV